MLGNQKLEARGSDDTGPLPALMSITSGSSRGTNTEREQVELRGSDENSPLPILTSQISVSTRGMSTEEKKLEARASDDTSHLEHSRPYFLVRDAATTEASKLNTGFG